MTLSSLESWLRSHTLLGNLLSALCHFTQMTYEPISPPCPLLPSPSVNWVYNRNTNSMLTKVILSRVMIRLQGDVLW